MYEAQTCSFKNCIPVYNIFYRFPVEYECPSWTSYTKFYVDKNVIKDYKYVVSVKSVDGLWAKQIFYIKNLNDVVLKYTSKIEVICGDLIIFEDGVVLSLSKNKCYKKYETNINNT